VCTRAGMIVAAGRLVPYLVSMQTWVLVITLLANSHPVGITSIAGYTSEAAVSQRGRCCSESPQDGWARDPILLSLWTREGNTARHRLYFGTKPPLQRCLRELLS
jgi:hypothetical protein